MRRDPEVATGAVAGVARFRNVELHGSDPLQLRSSESEPKLQAEQSVAGHWRGEFNSILKRSDGLIYDPAVCTLYVPSGDVYFPVEENVQLVETSPPLERASPQRNVESVLRKVLFQVSRLVLLACGATRFELTNQTFARPLYRSTPTPG